MARMHKSDFDYVTVEICKWATDGRRIILDAGRTMISSRLDLDLRQRVIIKDNRVVGGHILLNGKRCKLLPPEQESDKQ
jgi:hypothetical protein